MDFGSYAGYGIPYKVVTAATPRVTVAFEYDDESDPGPYPIPASPLIEGGSDRHILIVDRDACRLYELFDAREVRRGVAGREWRDLGHGLERAPPRRVDQRGRRRPADPARPRPVRRGRGGRHHPRAAVHDEQHPASYIYPARHHASESNLGQPATDGAARPAEVAATTPPAVAGRRRSSPTPSSATG